MSDSKNTLIKHAKINWSDQSEPFSTQFADVYFNTEQGLNESSYVFLQGNRLQQRWRESSEPVFTIAETGFGTGLNFLMTCSAFQCFQKNAPNARLKRLHFSSFEKYPLTQNDLRKALQRWPSLSDFIAPLIAQYPPGLAGCHRIMLDKYNITLDLWFGDVLDSLPSLYNYQRGLFDCWYLDGFAPSKNPDMWNAQLFKQIAATCKTGATIATFTAAGFVRRALIAAGFTMQKRKGYGKKREMLVGQIARTDNSANAHDYRSSPTNKNQKAAIIGGDISSACLALALLKRGYKVTLYCKDSSLAQDGQGALYPRLNAQHDSLSQWFANSFLFTRNYVQQLQQRFPFACDLTGLLQISYDQRAADKLEKILDAQLPKELVHRCTAEKTEQIAKSGIGMPSLLYPLGGWLSPTQMIASILQQAKMSGHLTLHFNQQLNAFQQQDLSWDLHFADADKVVNHALLILCCAFDTVDVKQCAARDQGAHIPSSEHLYTLGQQGALTSVPIQQPDHFPYVGAIPYYPPGKTFAQDAHKKTNSDHAYFQKNLYMLAGLGSGGLSTAPLLAEMLAAQICCEPLPFSNDILEKMQDNQQWANALRKANRYPVTLSGV